MPFVFPWRVGNDALFLMLSILDILLFSICYVQQILENFPPFITVPTASRCCVSFVKHILLYKLHMARHLPEKKKIVLSELFSKFILCFAT